MPKCISCNEVYADQLRRCPHCGYTAEPLAPEPRPARAPSHMSTRPRVKRLAVVAVLAAGAALAGVVAWPSVKAEIPEDLSRSTMPTDPVGEFDPFALPQPDEIESATVDKDFHVTEARLEGGEVVVTGTCSARSIVRVTVNGRPATILREGGRFVARLPDAADIVEVVADGIRGDRAVLRKDVVRVEQGDEEEMRLVSHADGATAHVPLVRISCVPWSGSSATARSAEVPLAQVENRFGVGRSFFVLYRAPDGMTYLRTTTNGARTFHREIDNQEMVLVPGGVSWRGMGNDEPNGPRHIVELSPFLIDRTEVTCAQYSLFLHAIPRGYNIHRHPEDPGIRARPVGWTGDQPPPGTEDLPVTGISWYSAWSYARWVGGRLPTETEWERAAAGPMGRPYPWGDAFDAGRCRMRGDAPLPSDSLVEGAGFYDLLHASGNVREWCLDRFDPRWYTRGSRKDPRGPSRNTHRVVRGGSFASPPEALRLQFRDHFDATRKSSDIGFRVARPWDDIASPDGD